MIKIRYNQKGFKRKHKVFFYDKGKTRLSISVSNHPSSEPAIYLQLNLSSVIHYDDSIFLEGRVQVCVDKHKNSEQYAVILDTMYKNPLLFDSKEDSLNVFGDMEILPKSGIFGNLQLFPYPMSKIIDEKRRTNQIISFKDIIDVFVHYRIPE